MKYIFTLLMVFFSLSLTLAQEWNEIEKSYSPTFTGAEFGSQLSIHGDYAVFGVKKFEANEGAALVYHFDGVNWNLVATLLASDGATEDQFGYSVDIFEDQIVIGAPYNNGNGSTSGAIYQFTKPISGWTDTTESVKIVPIFGNSYSFGRSISITDSIIAVGAQDSIHVGKAHIYEEPIGGWNSSVSSSILLASDGFADNFFSYSMDLNQSSIVIGAIGDSANGNFTGAAYVFNKPSLGWTNMNETAKLLASDGDSYDQFGNSVSISDTTIAIGAKYNDAISTASGAVYVFSRPIGGWVNTVQTAKLTSSDAIYGDNLGESVDMHGDTILVGAYASTNQNAGNGSAYVYVKPVGGWVDTTEIAILTASIEDPYDYFGVSVGIYGSNVLVGAYKEDTGGADAGAVYAFQSTSSQWQSTTETSIIIPPLLDDETYGFSSVAIDGKYAVVGAMGQNTESGNAYVLYYTDSSWVRIAELTPSVSHEDDEFGHSVSILGDDIVVGSRVHNDSLWATSGLVYVYTKPINGWHDMLETAILSSGTPNTTGAFGGSVSISDSLIVVGATSDSELGGHSGAAYVFEKPQIGWVNSFPTAKLTASDGDGADYFGVSVACEGNVIVVGAAKNTNNSQLEEGKAYVYEKPGSSWINTTENAILSASDGGVGHGFGTRVDISGDHIVVGKPRDNSNGTYSGSAYVFKRASSNWTTMTETARLISTDNSYFDFFGFDVSIDGSTIIIGATNEDDMGANSGAVYLFSKPNQGWIDTTETEKYSASNGDALDRFGFSTDIDSGFLIVGAKYEAYLFEQCSPKFDTIVEAQCENFIWGSDGNTYSASGLYSYQVINPTGCDSTLILDLTILNPDVDTVSVISCDSYFWNATNISYSNNGLYTATLTNSNGCDSLITLDLTLINSSSSSISHTECESYTWPLNGVTYYNSGNYSSTVTNFMGCDSVITLNLTIPDVYTAVNETGITLQALANPATYQWLDCDNNFSIITNETNQTFTPALNGNYAVEITQNGCVDTSACFVITNVGLLENEFGKSLMVYPSPTQGIVTVELLDKNHDLIQVRLSNALGQEISMNSYHQTDHFLVEILGVSGVYFLEIESSDHRKAKIKILKQ
jgi:phage gp45-like